MLGKVSRGSTQVLEVLSKVPVIPLVDDSENKTGKEHGVDDDDDDDDDKDKIKDENNIKTK
eukprot:Pgem_evm1s14554